ncbi:MAG: hypothetical protein IT373_03415 [Polyangiaceae bacterium]|nr:hypothetical protein [Polyangiaceae bacterium]
MGSPFGRVALGACLLGAVLASGCSLKPPEGPVVPTPTSVTRDNPGGDARDPLYAALVRLRDERWSRRSDRFRTLDVPLADAARWLRVRFWGYPTRVGFRYGKDHLAVAVVAYDEVDAGQDTPQLCLERFIDKAMRVAKTFDVNVGELRYAAIERPKPPASLRRAPILPPFWDASPIPVVSTDGHFGTLLDDTNYLTAIASYPSWPGTCLVHAFAVETGEHLELARQVVDRWVREGAPTFAWRRGLKAAPAHENR